MRECAVARVGVRACAESMSERRGVRSAGGEDVRCGIFPLKTAGGE